MLDSQNEEQSATTPGAKASVRVLGSTVPWGSKDFLLCFAIAFLTLVAFQRLCSQEFEFFSIDDDAYVTANAHVKSGLSGENIRWAFSSFEAFNWHPLTWLSLQLDVTLYGQQPWGFRLTNILLHAANAILIFIVWRKMTGVRLASAVVAALFALHPLHVESVAWIAERKDVLSGFFWLLTILFYVHFTQRPSAMRYLTVMLSFGLGLMAKQMLVTLPAVLLLLDYWPLQRFRTGFASAELAAGQFVKRSWIVLLLEKIPLLAMTIGASLLTLNAQTYLVQRLDEYPLTARLANAVTAYAAYLLQIFWPTNLAFHYPHAGKNWSPTGVVISAALLIGLTSSACVLARRLRFLPVGWFWFLGTLVPVIGLVQVGTQARADRYVYMPILGILFVVVWLGRELLKHRQGLKVPLIWLTCGSLLVCLIAVRRQVEVWQNSERVFRRAIEVSPHNKIAHAGLAQVLIARKDMKGAEEEFNEALSIDPDYASATIGLVDLLQWQGRTREVMEILSAAVDRQPENAPLQIRIGQALVQTKGRMAESIPHLEKALSIEPKRSDALTPLGIALLFVGRSQQAIERLTDSVHYDPSQVEGYIALAKAQLTENERPSAIVALNSALQREPNNSEIYFLLGYAMTPEPAATNNSEVAQTAARAKFEQAQKLDPNWLVATRREAWELATEEDSRFRSGTMALLYARILSAVRPNDVELLDLRAAAFAENGNFEKAATDAQSAATLAEKSGHEELATSIRQRLSLYRAKQPYRQTKRGKSP